MKAPPEPVAAIISKILNNFFIMVDSFYFRLKNCTTGTKLTISFEG
jgi:hypothetical protein